VGFRFKDTELESLIIHFSSFINPEEKILVFFASFLCKKNTNEGVGFGEVNKTTASNKKSFKVGTEKKNCGGNITDYDKQKMLGRTGNVNEGSQQR
jgi:hypothetical protein